MRAPIQWAASSRWEAQPIVAILLEGGANPNASSGGTSTPLQICVEQTIPAAVADASPSKQFGEGSSEAHTGTHIANCEAAIEKLLEAGADPTLALKGCLTEFEGQDSVAPSRMEVIKAVSRRLVELGARPHMLAHLVRVTSGNSQFEEIVEHHCQLGAHVHKDFDDENHSAYHEVAEAAATQRISMQRARSMLHFLKNGPMDPETGQHVRGSSTRGDCGLVSDKTGGTSLHHVIQGSGAASLTKPGQVDLVHALVTLVQSDTNAVDANGHTPLQLAVVAGNVEVAEKLLDFMADPNSTGSVGTGPLKMALETNNVPMAKILLAHGATLPPEAAWGEVSPEMYACLKEGGHCVSHHETSPKQKADTPLSELIRGLKAKEIEYVPPPHVHLRTAQQRRF